MFLALRLTPAAARALARHGDRAPADLHLTLAFLGRALAPEVADAARRVARDFARRVPPFEGAVTGLRVFRAGAADVHVATVAAPGLARFRAALVRALARAGVPVDATHPFVPHVTLGVTAAGVPWTRPAPPRGPVRFDALVARGGDAGLDLPLRGAHPNPPRKVRVLPGQGDLFATSAAPRPEPGAPRATAAVTAPAAPVPPPPVAPWTGTAATLPDGPFFGGDEVLTVPFTAQLGIDFQRWLDRILDDLRNATTYAQCFTALEEYRQFWQTFDRYFVRALPQAMLQTRPTEPTRLTENRMGPGLPVKRLVESWPRALLRDTGIEKVVEFPVDLPPERDVEPSEGYVRTLQAIRRVRTGWERAVRAAFRGAWELLADVLHLRVAGDARLFNTHPWNTLVLRFVRPVSLRVEGLAVRTHGLDSLGETEARKVVAQLARVVRHLRQTTARTMPWFFRRLPPIHLEAYCGDHPGNRTILGRYLEPRLGGPRIDLCAQPMLTHEVSVVAFVLGHELGHHLWRTSLAQEAKYEWGGFQDAWFDFPVAKIVRSWGETPDATREEFLKRVDVEDPLLALRVRRLVRIGSPLAGIETFAQLRDFAAANRTVWARAEPITEYAETNAEEAFCEALGLAAAYGTKVPTTAGDPWRLSPKTVAQLQTVVPQVRTLTNGPRRGRRSHAPRNRVP